MTMISLPLWPTLAAVVTMLVWVYMLYVFYDERWYDALFGTVSSVVLSIVAFLCFYGVCTIVGGI